MKPGRNDMKKALERLQVNRPLRLPGEGPGLVPPNEGTKNEVPRHEAPLKQQTQFENPLNRRPQIEDAENRAPQTKASSYQAPKHKAEKQEAVTFPAPLQYEQTPEEVAHYEQPEDEAAQYELAREEVPDLEGPQIREPSPVSFFRMSPRVFSEAVIRNMSGDCFRLFLWLSWRAWRFPNSPGVVRAAVSFIESETGMGHATVSRCLKVLKELGLVTLVEVNFKTGNVWKVSKLACPGRSPEPGGGGKVSQNEAPRKKAAGASEPMNSHPKTSAERTQNEVHIKNYKNLNKTLCAEERLLFDRLDQIEAPKKREREATNLEALLKNLSPTDVLRAVEFVEKKGTLKGEACHSPYAYLTLAVDDVLKRVPTPSKVGHVVTAACEPESPYGDVKKALEVFHGTLTPCEREEYLATFVQKEFPHGFLPPRRVTETLAASAWIAARKPSAQFGLVG